MNDKCRHEWQIWPETDGYEQRCRICAAFRRTPDDDRNAAIGRGSSAPKPEAQGVGVDVRARYFLASGLDEYGHHSEAQNVRDGEDLESYRHELFAIKAALSTPASHGAQQPSSAMVKVALRNLPQYISKCSLIGPDKHSAMLCFETLRDALVQQPAVVGDGVDLQQFRQAVVHWYADADNANTNPEWTRGEAERLLAIIDAQAALTPAATPGEGTVSASDWRDLYRLQTAMRYMDCDAGLTRETAYSMADADIGRIEALAQKEGNGNG